MEASEKTIDDILSLNHRYVIPEYQRPYSWTKENVLELLEDVWEAYEADDHEYFIGSLITIAGVRGEPYEVVDGQQRLTTLSLIFARMRDMLDEPAKSDLGSLVLPRKKLIDVKEHPRLTLRPRDQEFYYRYVLLGEELSNIELNEITKINDVPKQRILENIAAIDTFIKPHDQEALIMFANYMLDHVYVVLVTTNTFESAYRLFNVLNARGVPLSNADLIKNTLFRMLGTKNNQSTELEKEWLILEERISIDRLDQFLGHHRSSVVAEKARKSLHEELKAVFLPMNNPLFILEKLNESSKNYMRILDNDFCHATAQRSIRSLHRVTFEEWIPPLLAFLNKPVDGLSIEEYINLLEKITYQNWIRRLSLTARLKVYFQLIRAINEGENFQFVREIFHDQSRNDEFISLLGEDVYGKPFTKALLFRLEDAYQDESVTKNFHGRITIEHVLPQSINDDYWNARFSEDDHRLWLHRLGNLTLLSGIKNYSAQNKGFNVKKEKYSQKNSKVSFDMTKEIIELNEWGVNEIESRHNKMVEAAKNIFSID